jgi:putative methyltransferase (TIGR04325 family)
VAERVPLSTRVVVAAKAVTPPVVWSLLKRLRNREEAPEPPEEPVGAPAPEPQAPPEWEYVREGWRRTAAGWDVAAVAEAYREKWPSFLAAVEGPGPLGVNHEVPLGTAVPRDDREAQLTVLAFAYALAVAARRRDRLSLLDWGGGPGHYAVLARALFRDLELEYHSRDLPALAALGRELLPDDAFHDDDGVLDRTYDLVVASSSLQYAERWRETLAGLARATGGYLYVARVPVALHAPSFVVLQRAHAYGYDTEYLGWVIARDELLAEARAAGLRLVREVALPGLFAAAGAPECPVEHRGYLFATTW